jgi:hypothetical protein
VPVRTLKEIWTILEVGSQSGPISIKLRRLFPFCKLLQIVREQCWLNALLSSCEWTAESPANIVHNDEDTEPATDDELQALLAGTYAPKSIPVSVVVPWGSVGAADVLHSTMIPTAATSSQPQVRLSAPGRGPVVPGRTEVVLAHDTLAPSGNRVEVVGSAALGVELENDVLEEVVRRGGGLGVSGRLWAGKK